MPNGKLFFTLDDSQKDKNRRLITLDQAEAENKKHKGIFWTVNEFDTKYGTNEQKYLTKLSSWYVDLDNVKPSASEILYGAKLYPSLVVETKSGAHLYWNCQSASMLNYTKLNKRLTYFFTKESSVYDPSRILRVPGFYHWKDIQNPFKCEIIFDRSHLAYSENQMLWACKDPHPSEIVEHKQDISEFKTFLSTGDSFFSWLDKFNQKDMLQHISGKSIVFMEVYSFKKTANGKFNIYVNNEPTACWIDNKGKIGSHAGGGPTIFNWLKYFGMNSKEAIEAIKREFNYEDNNTRQFQKKL